MQLTTLSSQFGRFSAVLQLFLCSHFRLNGRMFTIILILTAGTCKCQYSKIFSENLFLLLPALNTKESWVTNNLYNLLVTVTKPEIL